MGSFISHHFWTLLLGSFFGLVISVPAAKRFGMRQLERLANQLSDPEPEPEPRLTETELKARFQQLAHPDSSARQLADTYEPG